MTEFFTFVLLAGLCGYVIRANNQTQKKLKGIMATQAELDAAIAGLPAAIETAVESALAPVIALIIAKAQGTGVDFSPEIAQLNAIGQTVGTQVATDLTPTP